MKENSAFAADAAARLWARTVAENRTPHAMGVAAVATLTALGDGLGRWIGAGGYRALFDRALGAARADHPWLAALPSPNGAEDVIAAAVESLGTPVAAAGVRALFAALIELLGRIVGQEMAVRLIEQSGVPSSREVEKTETEVERDD